MSSSTSHLRLSSIPIHFNKVVVFVNGGSLSPDWIKHHCPTVVEAMYGGQSGGTALGEVLTGDVSPSGILPYTMYPVGYLDQVGGFDCHDCDNSDIIANNVVMIVII